MRVVWEGVVSHRHCAGSFLVKYWPRSNPSEYRLTEMVEIERNYVDIEVTPKILYQFQVKEK